MQKRLVNGVVGVVLALTLGLVLAQPDAIVRAAQAQNPQGQADSLQDCQLILVANSVCPRVIPPDRVSGQFTGAKALWS